MRDGKLGVVEPGCNQRGPHAGGGSVPVNVCQDGFVGLVDGIGEHLRPEGRVHQAGVGSQRLVVAKVRKYGIDRDFAGYFARRMSPHAVADNETPCRRSMPKLSSFDGRTRPTSLRPTTSSPKCMRA